MVYLGKNSDNKYIRVPEYAIRYLEHFKIIPCSKYTFNDPNLGETGMVEFYLDNDKRNGLAYEINGREWKLKEIKNLVANIIVATFDDNVLKIGSYCISHSRNKNGFTVKIDSGYSGISSEVSITNINDKKIKIELFCIGESGEFYRKDTTIPKGSLFYNPEDYFETMSKIVDVEKYWRCSDRKISYEEEKAMQEIELLDQLIHDERLQEALKIEMKSMVKWEYNNVMQKARQGNGKYQRVSEASYEQERMTFVPSDIGDIKYSVHKEKNK